MRQREEIMQQAMGLSHEDRAVVAAALAYSLSTDSPEVFPNSVDPDGGEVASGEVLLRELRRRSEALCVGATTARPAAEVLADLLRRQTAERLSQ